MEIIIYDPQPPRHDYLSPMYFQPMVEYANRNKIPLRRVDSLLQVKDSIVCCLADYLEPNIVSLLKNNGNKIVGFSITDSSYISQCCRSADVMSKIDLIFASTGLQTVNHGHEMVLDENFSVKLEQRQFLPEEDWQVFDGMRKAGRLQSLPYVHWERQPQVDLRPYSQRSQKALIRGGHHMRRFILALKLMNIDRLDINSGFVTTPYFQEDMNPQFRYCDDCRRTWKQNSRYPYNKDRKCSCVQPPLDDLGRWNNVSPSRFYGFAEAFGVPNESMHLVEKLMNARWMSQKEHLEMLARITFTSDLKWLFSIYAAQRFWDAAMAGCINVLPSRTGDQEYFPKMVKFEHFWVYDESMHLLPMEFTLDEGTYNSISKNAKELYDTYMKPTDFSIGTQILEHIFTNIERHTA